MKKHLKYLVYLLKHKWFVLKAGWLIQGLPTWRLVIHDWSKFTPWEWPAYVNRFFGENNEADKVRFKAAVAHHYRWNPHHWEHWVGNPDSLTPVAQMPRVYVYEMVADWCGAGRGISGKWEADVWYATQQHRILLHPLTKALAERVLLELCAELKKRGTR